MMNPSNDFWINKKQSLEILAITDFFIGISETNQQLIKTQKHYKTFFNNHSVKSLTAPMSPYLQINTTLLN